MVDIEFFCVVITTGQTNLTSIYGNVFSNFEIFRHERVSTVVLIQNLMPFEEGSLRYSTVLLFRFDKHDRFVFKVIVHNQVSYSIIFKSALYDMLLAETVKSQDLFVKFDIDGFKLLLDVNTTTNMVWILIMRQRLACCIFGVAEVLGWWSGYSMKRYSYIFVVSDLLKMYMRNFLVASNGGIVCYHVSR